MKIIPKNLISQRVTRNIGRKILTTKKNSPHIFFVGGVIGVVGSAVLACRATLKLEENLDEIKRDVDTVKEMGKTIKIRIITRMLVMCVSKALSYLEGFMVLL